MSFGMFQPKPKKVTRKGKNGPIKRRPSYQRRHLMNNISQSIQAHINRLAQPVARNPLSQSPFAFMKKRLMAERRPIQPLDWLQRHNPTRKLKRRKIRRNKRKRTNSEIERNTMMRKTNLQDSKNYILPSQLSSTIANFEKARVQFLESLTQIQKQISNLKLPMGLSDKTLHNKGPKLNIKRPPTKTDVSIERPTTVFLPRQVSGVKLAPSPTKGIPPRPGTPLKDNGSNNIQHLFGPKLRHLMSKAGEKSLTGWSTL